MLHTKLYLLHAPFLKFLNFFRKKKNIFSHNLLTDVELASSYIQAATSIFQPYNLQHKKLLELGPGKNFAVALALTHLGARVSVADRFLATWDDAYHPKLYGLLAEKYPEMQIFNQVVTQNSYAGILELIPAGAESLNSPASFDFVLSNAVLEHLEDPALAFKNLYRLTNSGGKHFHQVDLRYHTLMSRPLEHLLIENKAFNLKRNELNCENGCQWRNQEFIDFFAQAGFNNIEICNPQIIDSSYFSAFLPKLRTSHSAYKDWPVEDLKITSAFYTFSKPE